MAVGWDVDPVVASWPGRPALDGDTTADLCVVGLGASGLAAVAYAQGRGLDVVGVDAGRIAAGAAGRNGGFLLAGPADPLHTACARWGEDAAVALYRATLAELHRETDRYEDVIGRTGSLRIATDAAELADCTAQAAALRAHGFAVEEYAGLEGEGLYFPSDAATNPAARAVAMAAGLRRLHERTPATSIRAGLVTTPTGRISAPLVLVAVDGRLDALFPALPVRTARLQMLATAPVPPRLRCPVYARWGYDYAQQDAIGRLFVGGGRDLFEADEWTDTTDPTDGVQRYLDSLAAGWAGGPVEVTHRWAASVGFTADAKPVCAFVDEGVVAVGGYNGTGNLVGPVAARAGVDRLVDGAPAPSWATGQAQ